MSGVKDKSNEKRKKWGMAGNGGRDWAADCWTNCLLASYFSVTPLHCSTPCRSWEGAVFSTSSLLCCLRGDKSFCPKRPNTAQHGYTSAAAVFCTCLLSGALMVVVLLLLTSQCRTVLRPDSSFLDRAASRAREKGRALLIQRCSEEMRGPGKDWSIPQCTGSPSEPILLYYHCFGL